MGSISGGSDESPVHDRYYLKNSTLIPEKLFTYVCYDQIFKPVEIWHPKFKNLLGVDNLKAITFLREVGTAFAERIVEESHLL